VREQRRKTRVMHPVVVPMAIAVDAVVAAGTEEEAEGAVAVVTVPARRAVVGIMAIATGVVSRATGLTTVEASNP
jgi:hypothetical protein